MLRCEIRWCGLNVRTREVSVPGAAFAAAAQMAEPMLSIAFLIYAYSAVVNQKSFGVSDIKSIGMAKDLQVKDVREYAEAMLQKARAHVSAACHAENAKGIHENNALAIAFGRLDVAVAECFATNRAKVDRQFVDVAVSDWAVEFASAFGDRCGASTIVDEMGGAKIQPTQAAGAQDVAVVGSNAVVLEQFTKFESHDALAKLRKDGINPGVFVAPRDQKPPLATDALKVIRISGDSVLLQNFLKETITKSVDDVLSAYEKTDQSRLKAYNANWPKHDVSQSKEVASAINKARVLEKVSNIGNLLRHSRGDMSERIRLVKKGGVETKKGCACGTIVLTPGAFKVDACKNDKKIELALQGLCYLSRRDESCNCANHTRDERILIYVSKFYADWWQWRSAPVITHGALRNDTHCKLSHIQTYDIRCRAIIRTIA